MSMICYLILMLQDGTFEVLTKTVTSSVMDYNRPLFRTLVCTHYDIETICLVSAAKLIQALSALQVVPSKWHLELEQK